MSKNIEISLESISQGRVDNIENLRIATADFFATETPEGEKTNKEKMIDYIFNGVDENPNQSAHNEYNKRDDKLTSKLVRLVSQR